jgi:hypothetical protein
MGVGVIVGVAVGVLVKVGVAVGVAVEVDVMVVVTVAVDVAVAVADACGVNVAMATWVSCTTKSLNAFCVIWAFTVAYAAVPIASGPVTGMVEP